MFGRKDKHLDGSRGDTRTKVTTVGAPRQSPIRPFWGLVCLAVGVFTALAGASFRSGQTVYFPEFFSSHHLLDQTTLSANRVTGTFGATYGMLVYSQLGYAGVFLLPAFALWLAFLLFCKRAHMVQWWKFALMALAIITAAGLADLFDLVLNGKFTSTPELHSGYGGALGELVYHNVLANQVGDWGSLIILGVIYLACLLLILAEHPGQSIEWWFQAFLGWRTQRAEAAKAQKIEQEKQKGRELADIAAKAAAVAATRPPIGSMVTKPESPVEVAGKDGPKSLGALKASQPSLFGAEAPEGEVLSADEIKKLSERDQEPAPAKLKLPRVTKEKDGPKIIAEEKIERAAPAHPQKKGDYVFPPLSLLAPPQARQIDSPEFHKERAEQLVQTLSEFGVKVQYSDIYTGPVITRYEVVPAPGVRVEKIVNLDKNLALALKAEGVRIIAPVPGKGTVGIEVPNRQPAGVCLREIIESRAWNDSEAEIPIVLGKDVTGKPIVVDLTKMPHALIAGSTGAGKTVCINAIIASLLFKMTAKDLRFIMVDPKIVEMQGYDALPHMLVPVVTDPKKVPAALKYLIREMERRYKMFAQVGARNIAGFNAKIVPDDVSKKKAAALEAEMSPEERAAARDLSVPRDSDVIEIKKEKLPYIVCIIDELADLMMAAPADIETCVARLAQLARAAGIHLILATQRPSVNVITGVIKANLPCRIAFKVASKVDSRTILDTGGADALIGRGDMLFVPPGSANLVRAQGAFVSDEEITSIVEFLKRNGDPEYDDDVQAQIEAGGEEGEEGEGAADDEEWDDKLVPQALDVLRSTKRASTSMLQRRLKIGYNRAARIMEILEAEGIVGPENGSSPREILKDLDGL
ncbi:MAG TPA: DNA translocase FtsK [Opitutales bacterium]|nr:DNA translocase FtsK [Opitutales bacterium]